MTDPADILLVDDDVLAQLAVEDIVDQLGHRFSCAPDGESARKALAENDYALVLLDRRLPDTDGLLLAPQIRAETKTPFIVLSSLDSPTDQALGLGMGAIDYVCKPIEPVILSARIEAGLAARRQSREQTQLSVGESLHLDTRSRRLSVAGRTETLSPTETRLLVCLIHDIGRPCDRMQISMAICGREWVYGDRTIDVLISRLRRRLRGSSAEIITVHGLGYSLIEGG